jgi:signal transduction histidine kinase
MPALPFMTSAANLLTLQAEEKGVQLIFDLAELDGGPEVPVPVDVVNENALTPGHDKKPQFLTNDDFFYVDQHKMGQVVRNLVSNAIKVRLFCYICIFYDFYVDSAPVFGWSAFLCRIRSCETFAISFD